MILEIHSTFEVELINDALDLLKKSYKVVRGTDPDDAKDTVKTIKNVMKRIAPLLPPEDVEDIEND